MESQPSKMARLANPRSHELECGRNMETDRGNGESAGSPPIGLGLELGPGGSPRRLVTASTKSYGLTALQLQELQLQTLIYRYVQAGFPVPYHLVLPIWKSVASCFGGLRSSSLHQLYPSVIIGCNPLLPEHKNGMELEPGRCRRTDGKKWRCSKEVLPDQKHCARHMHRGLQRSRKLVEAASDQSSTSTNLSISLPGISSTASITNLSPRCCLCPKSVLHGDAKKN